MRSVLIVEPNPGILIVGRNALARAGFEVTAVPSFEEGLAHARTASFDLALLDGKDCDPEIVLTIARSKPTGVPIVLTIPKGRDGRLSEAVEASIWTGLVDIADVVEKPFALERLLETVQAAVRRHRESTAPQLAAESERLFFTPKDETDETVLEHTDRFAFAFNEPSDGERTEAHDMREALRNERSSELLAARLRFRLESALLDKGLALDPSQVTTVVHACEAVLAEHTQHVAESRANVALSGDIEHFPIDNLFQVAASVAGPSRCRIQHEEQVIEVFFKRGQVVFARQEAVSEGFMLGRILVASGSVDEVELERIAAHLKPGTFIGQQLLSVGAIAWRDLVEALRRQTEELFYEAVRWDRGRFRVFANERLPPQADDANVCFPVQQLLLEGAKRLDEWRRILGEIGGLGSTIERVERSDAAAVSESLAPDERALLAQIDGHRTIEDLADLLRRPLFDVAKALVELRAKRRVAVVAEMPKP